MGTTLCERVNVNLAWPNTLKPVVDEYSYSWPRAIIKTGDLHVRTRSQTPTGGIEADVLHSNIRPVMPIDAELKPVDFRRC